MSAADNPKRADGRDPIKVTILATGETKTLPYRQAVGLLSLQRAVLAKPAKKKSTVSTPGGSAVQEGALPGNKPASGASSGGRS